MSLNGFWSNLDERHAVEVTNGEHDTDCEWEPGFYLCNCAKRRREASGFTTPPPDDLDFPPPVCPRCHEYVEHSGDTWDCHNCALTWDLHGAGSSARFMDDMGDLSRCVEHGRRACHRLHAVRSS
jgi:hypothetical protein